MRCDPMREYDVTYIAKEFLSRKGWKIIAYNPPGSQGTFTITNPQKDHTYKGQTGSLSPDIVAFKIIKDKNILYIVESKPTYNEDDVKKMINMFRDKERVKIFLDLIIGYTKANGINFDKNMGTKIRFAKAHGGDINPVPNIDTIHIHAINEKWDPENINPKEDIYSNFSVVFIPAS